MPQNFCPNCGGELQFKEAEICPKCGVRIKDPPQPESEKYAGVWDRFAAYFIDFIIGIVIFVIVIILCSLYAKEQGIVLGILLALILYWLYFAYFESSPHQATFGKQILKIKVTDGKGHQIYFLRSLGRSFFKILFTITPFSLITLVNALIIYYSEEKKGIHDYIADTRVIKEEP